MFWGLSPMFVEVPGGKLVEEKRFSSLPPGIVLKARKVIYMTAVYYFTE